MKNIWFALAAFSTALVSGCASPKPGLVLDPVGPQPTSAAAAGSSGSLLMFTAFARNADFNGLPYRARYSDYKVLTEAGQLVARVHNSNGTSLGGPQKVELAPGAYRVVARANGYGQVTTPVVIRAGQTTTVHLEGSVWWPQGSGIFQSNPVRLPGQEIVGWRAESPEHPGL